VSCYAGFSLYELSKGIHEFGSLSLIIRPPIYIPRIETEQWVLLLAENILSNLPSTRQTIRILDICSGSGCIPLLLAHQGGGRIQTVGLEVDDQALALARENAVHNKIDHLSTFEKFDLFEDDVHTLRERIGGFDMIISNPPYVSSEDMRKIKGTWWEGRYALQGKLKGRNGENAAINDASGAVHDEDEEDDGLSAFRRILEIYPTFLSTSRPDTIPKLVLEVGAKQSPPVKAMFASEGRFHVTKETPRRKSLSTPKLEKGDMVGTERSLWIYEAKE